MKTKNTLLLIIIIALIFPISVLAWDANTSIISGLVDTGLYSSGTTFENNTILYLIAGNGTGQFTGYNWTGTTWQKDFAVISGISTADVGDVAVLDVFVIGNIRYLISGASNGLFTGYNWTGTTWQSDTAIVSGLVDVGAYSSPTIFYNNSILYLITGETLGTFIGYNWTGTTWQTDTAIKSGLPDIGAEATPVVYTNNSILHLIAGNSTGLFTGYNWTGSTWQSNLATISGLTDATDYSSPTVFNYNNILYLISGEYDGIWYGYKDTYIGTPPSSEYIPPTPTNLAQTNDSVNFWINYTWQAGTGYVTNSYNITTASGWDNTTIGLYKMFSELSSHEWINITVYAFNGTGIGSLSLTGISMQTQVPNNVPTMNTIGAKNGNENTWVNFTISGSDWDGDSMTCSSNQTVSALTGCNFNWTTNYTSSGTYIWRFYLNDSYGGFDFEDVTVIITNIPLIIPPPIINSISNGKFYSNLSWIVGSGNITNGYNSTNGTIWQNSTSLFRNDTLISHAWNNITLYAWNITDNLSTAVTNNSQLSNNAITISGVDPSYNINEGQTLNIDANYTDLDGDTPIFGTNSTYDSFNTGTGVLSWLTDYSDAGIYNWFINVTDGYGSVSTQEFTITINDVVLTFMPPTPTNLAQTNSSIGKWVNYTWGAGIGNITGGYNVSIINNSISYWNNGSSLTYINSSIGSHEWSNISVYAYNSSDIGTLNVTAISMNIQLQNNDPTISFISPTLANASTNNTGSITINTTVADADSDNMTALLNWNSSLVGWWRMNEAAGGTLVEDFSGYKNNGTWIGNTTTNVTTGRFGNALNLDGSDDYITISNSTSLNPSNITVEVWFNAVSGTFSNVKSIVQKSFTSFSAPYYQYALTLRDSGGLHIKEGTFYFTVGGSLQTIQVQNLSYNYGKWHHLVGTFDGSNGYLYLDGIQVGTTSVSGKITSYNTVLQIGSYPNLDKISTYLFNGDIDEVRIYNRALSAEDINASYNASLYRLNATIPGLTSGSYNYTAYIQDAYGSVIVTDTRHVSIDVSGPTAATLLTPTDGDHTNVVQTAFDWSDTTDVSTIYYNLQIANASNFSVGNLVHNLTGISSSTYTLSAGEALTDGIYYWRVRAYDSGGFYGDWSSNGNFTVVIDTNNPDWILGNYPKSDNSTRIVDSITWDPKVYDANLYRISLNVTNISGYLMENIYIDNYSSSWFNFSNTTDTSSWAIGNYTVELSAIDDHTDTDTDLKKGKKGKKGENIIIFNSSSSDISISAYFVEKNDKLTDIPGDFASNVSELINGQYKFDYNFTVSKSETKLILNINSSTGFINRTPMSKIRGHLVWDKYYIDFADVPKDMKVTITNNSAFNYIVRIEGITPWTSGQKIIIDPVAGGLNIQTENYTIEVYDVPIITSWGNNKTNNQEIAFSIDSNIPVNFNITSNQDVTTYNWYKDDISQSNNFNNITLNWSTAGTKTVKVSAMNTNGTTQIITWTVTITVDTEVTPDPATGKSPWPAGGGGIPFIESTKKIKKSVVPIILSQTTESYSENFTGSYYKVQRPLTLKVYSIELNPICTFPVTLTRSIDKIEIQSPCIFDNISINFVVPSNPSNIAVYQIIGEVPTLISQSKIATTEDTKNYIMNTKPNTLGTFIFAETDVNWMNIVANMVYTIPALLGQIITQVYSMIQTFINSLPF